MTGMLLQMGLLYSLDQKVIELIVDYILPSAAR